MNLHIQISIHSIDEILIARRNIYDFLSSITKSNVLPQRICSDFSEIAKKMIQDGSPFNFDVQLKSKSPLLELRFFYLLNEARSSLSSHQENIYQINELVDGIPSENSLKEILLAKNRDALFKEIQEKNELLQVSSEEALRATKIKSDFMSNMSHEIRTPMNAIIGMTHLILATEVNDQQRMYLHRIHQSSQHLLKIINDILDFSKIEAGNMELDITEFPLNDLLANLFNNVSLKCDEKNIELICEVDSDVPQELKGDFLRISQVLINFVSNATKFTEAGEITIKIAIESRDHEHLKLRFNIIDTGIGISESAKERLFKSFQQADTSNTRKYGGTGLGLSISKQLVELMGGAVGFSSEEGVGSDFWFTVDFKDSPQQAQMKPIQSSFIGIKAFVLDDNEFALKIVATQLSRLGFDVDTSSSPLLALDRIKQADQSPKFHEVIFVDHKMPQMNGEEFAVKLSELQLTHKPKLVLLASFGLNSSSIQASLFDEIIYKPAHASNLLDTVSNLFLKGRSLNDKAVSNLFGASLEKSERLSGTKILLVEDNQMNQEVATGLIKQLNQFIEIEIAENGEIAIQKSTEKNWDLILMDIHMPIMDGNEATSIIREDISLNHIPIIALTANVLKAHQNQYTEMGMNDFIAKPILPEDLYRLLFKWIHPDSQNHLDFLKLHGTPTQILNEAQKNTIIQPNNQDLLSKIQTIDTHLGLQYTNGDEKLYFSILKKFLSQNKEFHPTITQLLNQNDQRSAERLAHTLKSTSGSIGARSLSKIVATLEKLIKDKKENHQYTELLTDISNELNPILQELEAIFPLPTASATLISVDISQLQTISQQLAKLLKEDDIQSTIFFGSNDLLLRSGFKDHYQELEDHIKNYDFAQALVVLNKACYSINLTL